jgi:hypothetical protein
MRNFISLSEALDHGYVTIESIPDAGVRKNCCAAFNELARLQRGKPEVMGGASLRNKGMHPNGTGLYTYTTEHVGDLTNRMAADWATGDEGDGCFGYQYVHEKVERALRHARNPYGFEREIREQTKRNYDLTIRDREEAGEDASLLFREWWAQLEEAGLRFTEAHARLQPCPVDRAASRDGPRPDGIFLFRQALG